MDDNTTDEEYKASHIDTTRLPTKTMLHGTESNDKRATMPKWVHEGVKYVASERNRKLTQGILSYECLLFTYDEVKDRIDSIENKIEGHSVEYIDFEAVDELQEMTKEEAKNEIKSEIENPEQKRKQVRIWLPKSVLNTSPWQRHWGSKLTESLPTMYASAFSDRLDRLHCKEQLIDYVQNNRKPTHPVAQDIVNDDMDDYIGNPEVITEVVINTKDDYRAIADDLSRWGERRTKLYELYESLENPTKEDFVTLVTKAHKLDKSYAVKVIDTWCEIYEIFDEKPLAEYDVTPENFAELVTDVAEAEVEEAKLINQLFKHYAAKTDKVFMNKIRDQFYGAGLIDSNDRGLVKARLESLDKDYGLSWYSHMEKGNVYLSTNTVGDVVDRNTIEEENNKTTSSVGDAEKKADELIQNVDDDIDFSYLDWFEDISDTKVQIRLIERVFEEETTPKYPVTIGEIQYGIKKANWEVPDKYDSLESWVTSEFRDDVNIVDGRIKRK